MIRIKFGTFELEIEPMAVFLIFLTVLTVAIIVAGIAGG